MKALFKIFAAMALLAGIGGAATTWMRNRNNDDDQWEDDYNPDLAGMQRMSGAMDGSAMTAENPPTEAMQH
jgi:hypothetical protein